MSKSGSSRIFRVRKDQRYFVASNEPFVDVRLSWEARGVMAYLLTKPNDWVVKNEDLITHGPAGEKKIESILRELKKYGYLRRLRTRPKDSEWFVWVTEVYESPSLNPDFSMDSGGPIPPKQGDTPIPPKQGDTPIPPFLSDTIQSDTLGGGIQSTELASTESASTEPTATTGAAVAEILKSMSIRKNKKTAPLFVADRLTLDYATRCAEAFATGNYPPKIENPAGWFVELMLAGDEPPQPGEFVKLKNGNGRELDPTDPQDWERMIYEQ